MILSEMTSKIETGIQDSSFDDEEDIIPLINEALENISDEFCFSELATTGTLTVETTDSGYVDLPDDYHHDVYRVKNDTYSDVVCIRSNINVLEVLYDGSTQMGVISDVAIEGSELHYKPGIGVAQDLTILYYKKFTELEDEDDTPSWLPTRFHRGVVVDYVLKELWALVEDGLEGQKVNTAFYEQRYERARAKVSQYTRRNPKQKPIIKRTARFF